VSDDCAANIVSKISANEPLTWMMRIGYVSRGLVFLIVGGFALLAAGGSSARPQGVHDALQTLLQRPLGGFLLWTLAAGLSCFAGWRFLQSILDVDRHGTGLYGLMRRGGFAVGGLFYLALAAATARITVEVRMVSEDQSARDWTQWLMAKPYGRVLLASVAAGFAVAAISLMVKAIRASYCEDFDERLIPHSWLIALGSFGILTRAFVFLAVGVFLGLAAYYSNSKEAVGLAGVLRTLQHQSYGGLLLGLAGFGLLAFGLFEIAAARARRMRTLNSSGSRGT
jgi:hypothetical protein